MAEDSCCSPSPNQKQNPSACCSPTLTAPRNGACCAEPESADDKALSRSEPGHFEKPGYRLWPFVCGWLTTPLGEVPQVRTRPTWGDRLGHWQMRWGIGRLRYRIAPGLYAVGQPDQQSAVVVTANYKMSFDTLRRELKGRDLWILVLETFGINVWCAAGKGSFGTDELVRRVNAVKLDQLVEHRRLILPQLGAVGVAAHKVKQACGFQVVYGPVRAADLPVLLDRGEKALTPAMRRVTFSTLERLVLTPVELTGLRKIYLWVIAALLVLGGIGPGIFSFSAALSRGGSAILAAFAGVLAGAVVTPLLLPWLPGRAFAAKGALVGAVSGLGFGMVSGAGWANLIALILGLTALSSYCAMNFTGSTTFTSPSGVEKEMRSAIPLQAGTLLLAGAFWIGAAFSG